MKRILLLLLAALGLSLSCNESGAPTLPAPPAGSGTGT